VLVKAAVTKVKNLRTDQFVQTKIIWNTNPVLTVPITAVLRINGQYFVYVATPEKGGELVKLAAASLIEDVAEFGAERSPT